MEFRSRGISICVRLHLTCAASVAPFTRSTLMSALREGVGTA